MKDIINSHFAKKYLQLILIFVFFIFTYGMYFIFKLSKERPEINNSQSKNISLNIVTLVEEDIRVKSSFPANVTVRNFIDITPRITGRVISASDNFKTGLSFLKNNELFKIDPIDYDIRVKSARAGLKKAIADHSLIKAESDVSIKEWKIINPNIKIPDLVAKKPELLRAKANIISAQAQLEQAKLELSYTSFKFPFDGIINNNSIEKGSFVIKGQSYGKAYIKDSIEIKLQISQGQPINKEDYSADIFVNGNYYPANIDRILTTLDTNSRMRDVILKVNNNIYDKLKVGMFIKARLIRNKNEKLYRVTDDILEDGKLRILSKNNTLSFHKAEILGRNNNITYIRSLGKNIKVIKGSSLGLNDGDKVKVN